MKRYILTGTPGAGKTSVLRLLESLGYAVVEEAATAVIALEHALGRPDPWTTATSFIDRVVALQRQRELRASARDVDVLFFDRSPICTYALSSYADQPISATLAAEVDRITEGQTYQRDVFFVRNLGFVEPTAARRITFADSLRFERIHEETYRAFGYHLVDIPAAPLTDRVATIRTLIH
jgi:predicted ATPase